MNLHLDNFDVGNIKMPNNLEMMIRKSGMMRKEVAERKGCRPETVSRHVSGALNFTLKDAKEYAVILGCNPQDIMFAQNAVPLFGRLDENNIIICDPSEGEISYHVPFPVDNNRRFVIANHTAQSKKWANGRMYMFSNECILKQNVDDTSFMRLSIFKIAKDNKVRFGVIYPQPGGTFNVGLNTDSHNPTEQNNPSDATVFADVQNNLTLSWATPVLSCIMQPDLLGIILKTH